ncbi:MAG: YigZ family protein [Dysgonamonadaceae bacterium]|jgi:uncharacterized YigZ family protein|nr:YigZ family protein [Dysgonamonadaceae bacterium]
MDDCYRTVSDVSEGTFTEQRSKFLAFAIPVDTPAKALEAVDCLRKRYHDARHVCWAYVIGAGSTAFRANDDGEPSSTAGMPILGVINSASLTDIIIIVVRYFGGVKLGTGGLISAYRNAAKAALEKAEIIIKTVEENLDVSCKFEFLNSVMKIIKEENLAVPEKSISDVCLIRVRIRKSKVQMLTDRLRNIESVLVIPAADK